MTSRAIGKDELKRHNEVCKVRKQRDGFLHLGEGWEGLAKKRHQTANLASTQRIIHNRNNQPMGRKSDYLILQISLLIACTIDLTGEVATRISKQCVVIIIYCVHIRVGIARKISY